jgi:hypothetical protein
MIVALVDLTAAAQVGRREHIEQSPHRI